MSQGNDKAYLSTCDHQHDLTCDRCNLFPTAVGEIESVLDKTILISHEEKEEIKFVVEQSKKNVDAWKSHLLRSVNQDEGRIDMLNTLDSKSVLVVLDWAMKFIPSKYRESQTDWFGKRGISWHVSVAMRKLEEDKPMQCRCLPLSIFSKRATKTAFLFWQ